MLNQTNIYPIVFKCGFDKRLPQKVIVNQIALLIFGVLLAISTILLNTVTIITYWKSTRLMRKKTHFMIMVLSSNDLTVGISSNVMFLLSLWSEYSSGITQCHLYAYEFYLLVISSGCSLMTLVIMSLERYAAIRYPFYHRTKVTKGLLIKCLLFLWIHVGFLAIMSNWFFIILFCVIIPEICLSIVLLFLIYGRIFRTAHRQFSVRVQQVRQTASQEQQDFPQNKKLAKSCLIAVLSFSFCYLPLVLIKIIDEFIVSINPDPDFILTRWSAAFILLNSSLNSIVFFWKIKMLRKEAFIVLKKIIPLSR